QLNELATRCVQWEDSAVRAGAAYRGQTVGNPADPRARANADRLAPPLLLKELESYLPVAGRVPTPVRPAAATPLTRLRGAHRRAPRSPTPPQSRRYVF